MCAKSELNCKHQLDHWEEKCATCSGLEKCRIPDMQELQFFLPMIPPTTTHQEKQVAVVKGKPVFYEPAELQDARAKLVAHLSGHVPQRRCREAVRLLVKWCFRKIFG